MLNKYIVFFVYILYNYDILVRQDGMDYVTDRSLMENKRSV